MIDLKHPCILYRNHEERKVLYEITNKNKTFICGLMTYENEFLGFCVITSNGVFTIEYVINGEVDHSETTHDFPGTSQEIFQKLLKLSKGEML